jgi:hypothetical protein
MGQGPSNHAGARSAGHLRLNRPGLLRGTQTPYGPYGEYHKALREAPVELFGPLSGISSLVRTVFAAAMCPVRGLESPILETDEKGRSSPDASGRRPLC